MGQVPIIIFFAFVIIVTVILMIVKKSKKSERYTSSPIDYSGQFTSPGGCSLTPVTPDANVFIQSYDSQPCVNKNTGYCDGRSDKIPVRGFDGVGIHMGNLMSYLPDDQFVSFPFGYNPEVKKYYVLVGGKAKYLRDKILANYQVIDYPELHDKPLQVEMDKAYQYNFNYQYPFE